MKPVWGLLGVLALAQICYPLVGGGVRAGLVVVIVLLGYATSLCHAALTRGPRVALALGLLAVVAFGVEVLGVHTGVPFGEYTYTSALGGRLLGVPPIIGFAWSWMAWPAWLVAVRLVAPAPARLAVAAVALATWDFFLDPQMVAAGYWRWAGGVIPVGNYLGWLLVAALVMAALAAAGGPDRARAADAPMYALYLWTYASSVLAHAVFLGLPASAAWGAVGMGLVAVPLVVALGSGYSSPSGRRLV